MIKICPRCGGSFECYQDNILECECVYIALEAADYIYLEEKYSGCLCADCLKMIKEERIQYETTKL